MLETISIIGFAGVIYQLDRIRKSLYLHSRYLGALNALVGQIEGVNPIGIDEAFKIDRIRH